MHDPTSGSCPLATWLGESSGKGVVKLFTKDPNGEDVECTFHDKLMYGDTEYGVDDDVYLTPDEVGDPMELARIVSMYEVDDEDELKRMTVQWYWRPCAIKLPKGTTTAPKEVFFSSCRDAHQSIDSLEGCAALPSPAQSCTDRPLSRPQVCPGEHGGA